MLDPRTVRAIPLSVFFEAAAEMTDSDPVISVFAAPQWDELNDDGKLWVAAIVRETVALTLSGALFQ